MEVTEIGTLGGRIKQLVTHFAQGNKSAFGRVADIESSVLSGIIGSRGKKPGFDLLQRLLAGYPSVNPDWLLFGQPPMLRDGTRAGIELGPGSNPIPGTIKTRLRYPVIQLDKKQESIDSYCMEVVRYLPFQLKKDDRIADDADGEPLLIDSTYLDTQAAEYVAYVVTQRIGDKADFDKIKSELIANGWKAQFRNTD